MAHIEDRWFTADRKPKPRSGHGKRYRVRYEKPDGMQTSASFGKKGDAERFRIRVEADLLAGTYADPEAGRTTLRTYAAGWLAAQSFDAVTRETVESRLRVHVLPQLGDHRLAELAARPSLIQAWLSGLKLAPSTSGRVLTHLNTIMSAAVADGVIARNPCRSPSIRAPRVTRRQVVPWAPQQSAAVRAALPERLRAVVDAGTGLGLRQSELFALAVEETDFLRRMVSVRQQIKIIRGGMYYAAPKGAKERAVPLAWQTGALLAAHLAGFPAVAVTLPWHEPGTRRHGKPHTSHLLFTTGGRALHRNGFNVDIWRPAVKAAGLPADRVNGCHMMRHVFASTLISRGVDVRTVAAYLGHSDGGALVLRTYSHLMPDAEDRARKALEAALAAEGPTAPREGVNRG